MATAGSACVGKLDIERVESPDDAGRPMTELALTDDDLAREINTEHGHVEPYKRNTIEHAIRCGELLLEMKQRVGHGNWLAWVEEHFEASERTARNYMEIAKSAAAADLSEDATMRSALRALASRSESSKAPKPEPKDERASVALANGHIPIEDGEHIPEAEVVEEPRAGLAKAHQRTWASVPARLTTISEPSAKRPATSSTTTAPAKPSTRPRAKRIKPRSTWSSWRRRCSDARRDSQSR